MISCEIILTIRFEPDRFYQIVADKNVQNVDLILMVAGVFWVAYSTHLNDELLRIAF
jgi:hypothetical protein